MKNNYLVLLVLSIFVVSCNNDSLEKDIKGTTDETYMLIFDYKGEKYSSSYTLSKDSTVNITDKKVRDVYQQLLENQDLASYEKADGSIEYFDDFNTMLKTKGMESLNIDDNITKSGNRLTLKMYEHINYGGQVMDGSNGYTNLGNKDLNGKYYYSWWNDRISSIYIHYNFSGSPYNKCIVVIARHLYLGGQTRALEVNRQSPNREYRNLKNIHYKVNSLSWKNWNDEISSFTYYLQY